MPCVIRVLNLKTCGSAVPSFTLLCRQRKVKVNCTLKSEEGTVALLRQFCVFFFFIFSIVILLPHCPEFLPKWISSVALGGVTSICILRFPSIGKYVENWTFSRDFCLSVKYMDNWTFSHQRSIPLKSFPDDEAYLPSYPMLVMKEWKVRTL